MGSSVGRAIAAEAANQLQARLLGEDIEGLSDDSLQTVTIGDIASAVESVRESFRGPDWGWVAAESSSTDAAESSSTGWGWTTGESST